MWGLTRMFYMISYASQIIRMLPKSSGPVLVQMRSWCLGYFKCNPFRIKCRPCSSPKSVCCLWHRNLLQWFIQLHQASRPLPPPPGQLPFLISPLPCSSWLGNCLTFALLDTTKQAYAWETLCSLSLVPSSRPWERRRRAPQAPSKACCLWISSPSQALELYMPPSQKQDQYITIPWGGDEIEWFESAQKSMVPVDRNCMWHSEWQMNSSCTAGEQPSQTW